MQGILIRTDQTHEIVSMRDELADYYRLIGCTAIDVVTLGPGLTLWLDDEGMYRGAVNICATLIARAHGPVRQNLYGNAILLGGYDDIGDALGLTDKDLTFWNQTIADLESYSYHL